MPVDIYSCFLIVLCDLRRVLVSLRRVLVSAPEARSAEGDGRRQPPVSAAADLYQDCDTFLWTLTDTFSLDNNPPNISPFRYQWVAQRKSEVNGKNYCLKLEYISKAKVD